jgi:hypothetical protein
MKWRLAIAATGVDKLGLRFYQCAKSVDQAEARRCVNVHDRSSLDRIGG